MNKLQMLKDLYNIRDINEWHKEIETEWPAILAIIEAAIEACKFGGYEFFPARSLAFSRLDNALTYLIGDDLEGEND